MPCGSVGATQEQAKLFFLLAAYGAGSGRWSRETSLAVPQKWLEFYREQRELRKVDAAANPNARARLAGCKRPEVTLQSYLNMVGERRGLNGMEPGREGRGV